MGKLKTEDKWFVIFIVIVITINLLVLFLTLFSAGVEGFLIILSLSLPILIISTASILFSFFKDKGEAEVLGYVKFISGEYMGALIPLCEEEPLTIGRNTQKSNIVLNNPKISRLHCKIKAYEKGTLFSVTNYSSNGIKVGNKKIVEYGVEVFVNRNILIYVSANDSFVIL